MTAKLLVRQGGGAAAEVDLANLGLPDREGVPFFDHNTSLITMGQRWEQGTAALGSFMYIDPHATHTHQFRPHASVKLVEDASGDDYIIAWNRIEGGNDTRRRSTTIGGDEVEHSSIGLGDCNLDLRGLPFATEWVRPAEDSWDRLQALAAAKLAGSSSTSTLHRATTNITVDRFTNGHLVDATSPVDLEAKTYPVGTGVEEILMDILEEWGKGWGVTLHHTGGSTHKCLLVQDIDDLAKFTSALRISDVPSDWDPLDLSAPTLEPNWKVGVGKLLENSHVISGLISIYGGTNDEPEHLYVETGEAPEDWEIWIDVYNDDLAKSEVQAERRANNVLNDRKRPYTTNRPSILLLPEQVTLITAGQAIEVKSVVMNQGALKHAWVWRRIAQITWEPSVDGRWWAHLELDRPRGSRPRVGAGQPSSTSPDPAPPPNPDEPGTTLHLWEWTTDTLDSIGGVLTAFRRNGTSPVVHPPAEAAFGTGGTYGANAAGFYQTDNMAVTAGTDYVFSVDILWRFDPTYRGLVLIWVDNVNAVVATEDFVVGPGHSTGVEYHESVTATAPVGATFVRVEDPHHFAGIFMDNLSMSTAGTVTADDPFALPDGGSSPYYARSDDPRFEADNQHLTSRISQRVTNNSGVTLAAGAVVVPDTSIDGPAVTRTTTASSTAGPIGVVLDGGADDAEVVVLWSGAHTFVDTNGTPADGDYLFTSTTAGVADCSATRATGAFGRVVRDDGAGETAYVLLWGVPDGSGGGGSPTGAAGGDLSGTYPNPSVVDDSHSHTGTTMSGAVGEILISDTPSTPLIFADLIQNEAQDDLVYADP